jgi:hypothetical protein
VAEHSTETDQWIRFQERKTLAKMKGHMDLLAEKSTEIKLLLNNINRKEGFKLTNSWNSSTRLLGHSSAQQRTPEEKIIHNRDTRLNDITTWYSWLGDHTIWPHPPATNIVHQEDES